MRLFKMKTDTESITIDNAELVISNVMIDQNKINVIIEQYDSTNFDKIISFEIVNNNYHLGFAGKIIDEHKIKKTILNKNSL